jgi:hypothetical protein
MGKLLSLIAGGGLGFLLSVMGYSALTWQFYVVFGFVFFLMISTHID